MNMHIYWIQFAGTADSLPLGTVSGCGVTADSLDDALSMLQATVFENAALPPLQAVREDVDIHTLDEHHVRPNMGNPAVRGVWFPQLNPG
jgi:hypothetical protein